LSRQRRDETLVSFLQNQIEAEEAVKGGADEMVQWTLTDHLNTVRDIAKYNSQTDTTTVVNHLVYDAFGKLRSETNPAVDSLFLFTGRPFDQDSQLQNNLNRWYDARVGRWLSEDPVGFAAGGMNLYRYVENQALTKTDPSGFDAGNANNPCPCGEALTQIWAVGPLNAFIADQLRQEAYAVTNDVAPRLPGGKGGIHNGAADAFRHCYWSCRMTEELGPEIAKRIADIHEFCARHVQPVAEEAMDQFNNKMGREFGQAVGRTGNCRERCEKAIREGRLQLSPGGPRPDNSYSDEYPQF